MDTLEVLLSREPSWRPPRAALAAWLAEVGRAGGPTALLQEARWWQAHEAALRSDWDRVTVLAGEGLGEPFSEREAFRLALLHAISGDVEEAQHVLAQAVQWRSDESLLERFAASCAAEGLEAAAALFRRLSGGGAPPPSSPPR
jgi:hypothetical protein